MPLSLLVLALSSQAEEPGTKVIRTQHVTNIDNDGPRLSWNGREHITHRKAGVRFSTRTNLEAVLTITLEQKCQATYIGVAASSPSPGCILRRWIVEQTKLC